MPVPADDGGIGGVPVKPIPPLPIDGDVVTYVASNEQYEPVAPGIVVDSDENVKASASDTTPGFLAAKLIAGANINMTLQNPGANESYLLSSASLIDATVGGAGGNFANVTAAKVAGFTNLRLIGDVTEPANVVVTSTGLSVYIDQGKIWDMGAFNIDMDNIANIQTFIGGLGTTKYAHTVNGDELFVNVATTSRCIFQNGTFDSTGSTENNTAICDSNTHQIYENIILKPAARTNSGIVIGREGKIDGLVLDLAGGATSSALNMSAGVATNVTFSGSIPTARSAIISGGAILTNALGNGDADIFITISGGVAQGLIGQGRSFSATISSGGKLSNSALQGDAGNSRITFSGSGGATVQNSSWTNTSFTSTPKNIRIVGCETTVSTTVPVGAINVLFDTHYMGAGNLTFAGNLCSAVNCNVLNNFSITGDYNNVEGGSCGDLVIGGGSTRTVLISGTATGNTIATVKTGAPIADTSSGENELWMNKVYG